MMLFEHGLQPQLPELAELCDLLSKLPVWLCFPTCKMGTVASPEVFLGIKESVYNVPANGHPGSCEQL